MHFLAPFMESDHAVPIVTPYSLEQLHQTLLWASKR